MAKKLSLQEVLDHITDQENSGSIAGIEEETTEDESYSEDTLQDILEEENITEQAENLATTEEEQSSDFEGQAEVDVTFWSKDGNLSSPTEKKGRLSTENVIKMTPGLTKYATICQYIIRREDCVPVAQWLEHCVSSAKVVGLIHREHTY